MVIAVTGAAGNLGSLLSRYLFENTRCDLRLLVHHKDVAADFRDQQRITVVRCDLAKPETIAPALAGVDCVVHFAGVLFKANPERFLPETNIGYFRNLIDAATEQKVQRVVLISFPHVEGITTPEAPATGRLDGNPESTHARTRLEEEKLLFATDRNPAFEPISLRVGMVYGRGILMIDAAKWSAKRWLLGVWREPTWIHLISTDDFLAATSCAATRKDLRGIYHLGDEGRQTLQTFLDTACDVWGTKRPWRMPLGLIYFAARLCEFCSRLFRTKAPLTRDFITIGRSSYYGDTSRMRAELLPALKFRSLNEGKHTL